MAADQASERRRKRVAYAIAAGMLLLLAAFVFRPATVLGVDGKWLANSLGGDRDLSRCVEISADRWRCKLWLGSDGATYTVETAGFGCWSVTGHEARLEENALRIESAGCIDGLDVISPI